MSGDARRHAESERETKYQIMEQVKKCLSTTHTTCVFRERSFHRYEGDVEHEDASGEDNQMEPRQIWR